jgi:hypothetical protein
MLKVVLGEARAGWSATRLISIPERAKSCYAEDKNKCTESSTELVRCSFYYPMNIAVTGYVHDVLRAQHVGVIGETEGRAGG